jgi:ferrous iron transport protein B
LIRRAQRSAAQFLKRAVKIILPIAMVLGAVSHLGISGQYVAKIHDSALSYYARGMTNWFAPMGLAEDNWPAVVGLILGLWAKEVVLGALTTLYGGMVFEPSTLHAIGLNLLDGIQSLPWQWLHPTSLKDMTDPTLAKGLLKHFHNPAQVMAYLVFITLYTPCMATVAVLRREVGWRWAMTSVLWSLILAFGMAFLVYQTMQGAWGYLAWGLGALLIATVFHRVLP